MLESDQIRAILEGAEERGYVDPAELEAFAAEVELNDDEVEELTRELERTGIEVGQPAVAVPGAPRSGAGKQKQPAPDRLRSSSPGRPTACSSSSPTSGATSS